MNSYQISSTLNPFFSKTPVKKESKPEKSYFRCKFLKILMYFCYKSEKPRENHRKTRKTLISTENDIERTLLYDERKIPLMDYMDIEESKETPPLSIEIGSNTSLKPSFKGSKPNYPFNKWFIFTNPTNKAQKVLTKISLYIKELKNANKRSFSFIKSPFLTYEPCSLYKSQEKGLVLDIFSDFEGLVSLQREFEDIITLQSNFFVANSLKKRLFLMNIKENMDFVVSDPLKFIYKGGNKRFDVIQLNFMHFQPENIEKNDFLIEITKKYAGLGDFIVVIMPKLAKIEEILSFFAKILYSLR